MTPQSFFDYVTYCPPEQVDAEKVRRALVELGVCEPPSKHPALTFAQWLDTWPLDCLTACVDFLNDTARRH